MSDDRQRASYVRFVKSRKAQLIVESDTGKVEDACFQPAAKFFAPGEYEFNEEKERFEVSVFAVGKDGEIPWDIGRDIFRNVNNDEVPCGAVRFELADNEIQGLSVEKDSRKDARPGHCNLIGWDTDPKKRENQYFPLVAKSHFIPRPDLARKLAQLAQEVWRSQQANQPKKASK